MITVVAKKDFFIRATGLLPNIIYCELPKLIYAYIGCGFRDTAWVILPVQLGSLISAKNPPICGIFMLNNFD